MTREGRTDRDFLDVVTTANGYSQLFAALFTSSFNIAKLEQENNLTPAYIIKIMYNRGAVAYDKLTKLWLPFAARGRDAYGEPETVELYGQDGKRWTRKRKDVYIFKANASAFPWVMLINLQARKLAEIDAAISQNLDAVKQMTVILSENERLSQRLRIADAARRAGASVAVLSPREMGVKPEEAVTLGQNFAALTTLKTDAEYNVDKLRSEWQQVYEHALHLLGVHTSKNKGERKTDNEIEAENGEADAMAYILTRQANADAIAQGAPFRFYPANDYNEKDDKEEGGEENDVIIDEVIDV